MRDFRDDQLGCKADALALIPDILMRRSVPFMTVEDVEEKVSRK